MDRPSSIEKCFFSCKSCGYTTQVFGDTYFDSGCHNYMATFECPDCKVLFEGLISQINMDKINFEAHHGVADEFECLRCGKKNANVWNKTFGKCPKCRGEMEYNVKGTIRLRF